MFFFLVVAWQYLWDMQIFFTPKANSIKKNKHRCPLGLSDLLPHRTERGQVQSAATSSYRHNKSYFQK